MATEAYKAGEAGLWVQVDGPNTAPSFLGCHGVGDVSIPFGDKTIRYCPDPAAPGKYRKIGSYRGEPGSITTTVTTYIGSASDYLGQISRQGCEFPLYVFKVQCGRRDTFSGWERAFGLYPADFTQRTLTNLASREPGDENMSEQSFDVSAEEFHEWLTLTPVRQSIAETTSLNSIWTCSVKQCAGDCGDRKRAHEAMIIGSDAPAGSPAAAGDLWYTTDQGANWNLSAMDPFAGGEDVISVVCFPVDATTTRWLAVREADAGAIQVSYSDDGGVTWTEVTVGAVAGLGPNGPRALFALDLYHVWLVLDSGYIYFSADGGLTWAAQEAGVVTANDLNGVWFADENLGIAVGDSDTVVYTLDGGDTWSAGGATGSGDDLLYPAENDGGGIWWTTTDGGLLYYSTDNGVTWTRRAGFAGDGTGETRALMFVSELTGFLVHNSAAPVGAILQTIDGGYSWKALTTPTNAGLNDITAHDENLAFAVGEAYGGTGMIVKIGE
jgi:photosystem II stability/assembly factor-like uncharacterized protein